MWSMHEVFFRRPACWSLSSASNVVLSSSKIILFNTLPGIDSNIIPPWFLHFLRLPFFGSFIRCPSFHSCGTSSSHICSKSSWSISVDVFMLVLVASGGILSGPGALPVIIWVWSTKVDMVCLSPVGYDFCRGFPSLSTQVPVI